MILCLLFFHTDCKTTWVTIKFNDDYSRNVCVNLSFLGRILEQWYWPLERTSNPVWNWSELIFRQLTTKCIRELSQITENHWLEFISKRLESNRKNSKYSGQNTTFKFYWFLLSSRKNLTVFLDLKCYLYLSFV